MAGTSSAKTRFALIPGHDEETRHRRHCDGRAAFTARHARPCPALCRVSTSFAVKERAAEAYWIIRFRGMTSWIWGAD